MMSELIYPELSYQVRGVLLEVSNTLGPMLKEAYYRDAIGIGLKKRGLARELEKGFEVFYQGERVGLYYRHPTSVVIPLTGFRTLSGVFCDTNHLGYLYVDAWLENGKILLELKVAPTIEPLHQAQAISYLKVTDADLAIVANYGGASLEDKRLPNFLRQRWPEFV